MENVHHDGVANHHRFHHSLRALSRLRENLTGPVLYRRTAGFPHRAPVVVEALSARYDVRAECDLTVEERLAAEKLARFQVHQGEVHRGGADVHRKPGGAPAPGIQPQKGPFPADCLGPPIAFPKAA